MFGFGMAVPGIATLGPPPRAENLLGNSWGFTDAYWGGDNAAISEFSGQPDPWGGFTSFMIMADGAGSANALKVEAAGRVYATQSTICLSAHLFGFSGATNNPFAALRIANGGTVYEQGITWNPSTGVASLTGTAFADGSGISGIGAGWFRAYITLNVTARGLNAASLVCGMRCFGAAAAVGQAFRLAGVQVNSGPTPTQYSARP